jgi:hypothetical protein
MMSKKQFQALKARDSKAQGEGCKAAETLGFDGDRKSPAIYAILRGQGYFLLSLMI